jgi:hypothetical protein
VAFRDFDNLTCHFASLNRSFRFDSRCYERPELNGPVVASLGVSRARTGILQCYPVPQINYSVGAVEDFEQVVVQHLVSWLQLQLNKPETAILGYEQIIVTWNGTKHEYAQVKYL